jgi:hypothetical protein
MQYTFEELKKQIISLDFSKQEEISGLNLNQLKQYVSTEIEITNQKIKEEIDSMKINEITNLEQVYKNTKLFLRSVKLPVLIPTLHLLNRIEIDLKKIN